MPQELIAYDNDDRKELRAAANSIRAAAAALQRRADLAAAHLDDLAQASERAPVPLAQVRQADSSLRLAKSLRDLVHGGQGHTVRDEDGRATVPLEQLYERRGLLGFSS